MRDTILIVICALFQTVAALTSSLNVWAKPGGGGAIDDVVVDAEGYIQEFADDHLTGD